MPDLCHPHVLSNLPGSDQDKAPFSPKSKLPLDNNSDDTSGTDTGKQLLHVDKVLLNTAIKNAAETNTTNISNEKPVIEKVSANKNQFFYHPALQNKRVVQPACSSEFLPSYTM